MNIEHVLTAISVAASIAAVVIAALAFRSQKRQSDINLQATIQREFSAEFFSQPHMRTTRFLASEFGLEKLDRDSKAPLPAVVFHLMDFLDVIAVYYNRDALDHEMAFARFYYWISHYWSAFGADIQQSEKETGLRAYANIPPMVEHMSALGKSLKWIEPHYGTSRQNLRRFFVDEMDECAGN
ncbi:MAG TPA: hypothetical protein VK749_03095 [Xanthobacteraceae bacterium]|nr:hypothetical protein [Xanthobacteraceae bacterium]